MVKSRLYGVENIRAMMAVLIPVFNVFTNYPQPYQIGETGAVIGAGRFGAGHRVTRQRNLETRRKWR